MSIRRGTVKPPFGAQVNRAHPFGKGLLLALLFNEPAIRIGTSFLNVPVVTYGSAPPRDIQAGGAPVMGSTNEGLALRTAGGGSGAEAINLGADFLKAAVTLCVVGHKTDTTMRTQALINVTDCNLHCPWADGNIYWDFVGQRVTVSGLTFSTTKADHMVFTGGPRGQAVWFNGVKVGTHTTPQTRTTSSDTVQLWRTYGPDAYKMNYFAAYDYQWDDALCRAWSAEPYAHLYPPSRQLVTGAAGVPPAPAFRAAWAAGANHLVGAGVVA
jgi:hypothetical protein